MGSAVNSRRILYLFWVLAGIAFLTGCNTTRDYMNSYEQDLVVGQYSSASKTSLKLAEKKDSTQLMWRLLAGNAYMLDNQSSLSIEQFDIAEDLFQANDAQSVFSRGMANTTAMLNNDFSFDYNGVGQDRIFCCFYKGMEYTFMGNPDAARTEFNRAADHQENWMFERRRDIQAAEERLSKEAQEIPPDRRVEGQNAQKQTSDILKDGTLRDQIKTMCDYDPALSGNLDMLSRSAYMNAYLSHFVGIFRWLNGDGGRGYLKDAMELCPGNPVVKEDYTASNSSAHPSNAVWIYVEDGLCAKREEWRWDLPAFLIPYASRYVLYAGMALPYLVKRDFGADGYYIGAEGGGLEVIPELQDVDRLLKTEYDVYMRGALSREITRTLLKIGSQVALGIAMDNTSSDGARLSLGLAQAGVATWAAASTEADVRCWSSLPKVVKMHRIARPADGKIVVAATNAGVRNEMHLELPAGNSIVWIRKTSRAAQMVAKVVTFP